MSDKNHADRFLEELKKIENEKPIKIYLDKQKDQKLIIDLDSGNKEHVTLNDSTYPVNLPDSSLLLLDEIIMEQQDRLLECAKDYLQSGRDTYFFLYDLISLCVYIDDLPKRFNKLKKIAPTDDELLHNRIHAELGSEYQKQNKSLGFEEENTKKRIPDLHVDSLDIEIKTITKSVLTDEDRISFSKSFRNSHDAALSQIDDGGMIVIGMWSQRMNNELKAYFSNLCFTSLPQVGSNKTILVLEGNKVFEDYFVVLPSNQAQNLIYEFAKSGYKRIDPMSYMNHMSREGFPHGQITLGSGMIYSRRMG